MTNIIDNMEEEEYLFIDKDELEDHVDSEVPVVKSSESLDLKTGTEKRNRKILKKHMQEKLSPVLSKLEDVNEDMLYELNEVMESVIEGEKSYSESRYDSLDVIADIIAHHKVVHDNITAIGNIIKKL